MRAGKSHLINGLFAEASLIERISECGTAALLAKPFGMRSLARMVREVLNEAV